MRYLVCFFILVILFTITPTKNEVSAATPFLELGAYHRLNSTDPVIRDNNQHGSDTPGTIDLGVTFERCGWFFGAGSCDVLVHHQSYVDRGKPFNSNPESYIDMVGLRFRWELR